MICRIARGAVCALLLSPAMAQEAPKEFTVKSGPFRHQIAVEGVLQPADATAVSVDPKQWKALALKSLVPHGSFVKKGETIATFDIEPLEEKVETLGRSREAARVTLERAELDLAITRQATPMELEAARRAARQAKENLDLWQSTRRALELEENDRNLKAAEQQLEYAREELKQLQVMYSADDLTEETEEIILKRSQWAVERAEFAHKLAKESHREIIATTVPRTDKDRQEAYDRAALALEKAEKDLAAALRLKELEVMEKRHAYEKEEKDFAELRADLDLLRAVTAPADGRLLWGDWTAGEGPARFAEFEKKHTASPRASVAPLDIFATVTGGAPVRITAAVPADVRRLVGWRGPDAEAKADGRRHVALEVAPQLVVPTRILSIDAQPDSAGRFPISLALEPEAFGDDDLPPVVPGMKARVILVDYRQDAAVVIPAAFIESSIIDGQHVESVLVKSAGGAPESRRIRTGHRGAKGVEVTEGLKDGDILLPLP